MIHDVFMVVYGWRGGPLEEHKRKHLSVVVATRLLLVLLSLIALIYSTVLIYSGTIQRNCYAGDPCGKIPEACEDGRVTTPCVTVYRSSLGDIVTCRDWWFNLAATYAYEHYVPTEPHYPNVSEIPKNDTALCNITVKADSLEYRAWLLETNQYLETYEDNLQPGDEGNRAREVGFQWLVAMNIPNGTAAPWNQCLSPKCYNVVSAVLNCPPYNQLIFFGEHSSQYSYALAAVWGSWAVVLLVILIFYLSFNAFPDYDNHDSWTESVKSMGRLLCCYSLLKETKTEEGTNAAEGLGELLYKLFGGIDLDPTDQILGLYLVSERQGWRRFVTAKEYIQEDGERTYVWRRNLFSLCWNGNRRQLLKRDSSHDKDITPLTKTLESQTPATQEYTRTGSKFSPLKMRYSILKIESDRYADEASINENESSCECKAPDLVQMTENGSHQRTTADEVIGREIILAYDKKPYLTPCKFTTGVFAPPISPSAAAERYLGAVTSYVAKDILLQCKQYFWYAKSSYGLQTLKWKDGKTGKWHADTLDMCLGCFNTLGGKAIVQNHFRKRNLNAILKYTNVDPSDILHVSYTDTALGILPYLVILDRETQSVVVSVRGTVETADLITDLLSHPHDCSGSMPRWVLEELYEKDENGKIRCDGKLFCHKGILSSAKAVLQDLDSKNILSVMEHVPTSPHQDKNEYLDTLNNEVAKNHNKRLGNLGQDEDVALSLDRAKSIMHEAATKGWHLVVTGHSLGAAVASLISFNLLERFPELKCIVYNPPGGVMDPRLSDLSTRFCTSVVVGCDAISRLSIGNMRAIVDDMVLALARCKRPKMSIILDLLLGRRKDPATAPPTFCRIGDVSKEVKVALENYLRSSELHSETTDAKLYPPGKILFLRPLFEFTKKQSTENFDAIWIAKEDLMDEGILIMKESLAHHHLWATNNALDSALSSLQQQSNEEQC